MNKTACGTCKGRGWALFYSTALRRYDIERCDACEIFASDDEAERFALTHDLAKFLAR